MRERYLSARRTRPFASALSLACLFAVLFSFTAPARAGVELPVGDPTAPVAIRGDSATHWPQGAYEVWVLRGNVQIRQKDVLARGQEAVLWIDRADAFSGQPSKVIAYLEGGVSVDFGSGGDPYALRGGVAQLKDKSWLGRFHTTAGIEMSVPMPAAATAVKPAIFERGTQAHSAGDPAPLAQAQFTTQEIAPPATDSTQATGGRRVRFFPRSNVRFESKSIENPNNPREQAWLLTGGVQILIDGIDQLGSVTIETDNLVFWTPKLNLRNPDLAREFQAEDAPLELYLEGNIVFRQGERVIYAQRMYYNVRQEFGVVLAAEMLTPVPEYQGLLRLRADVLQQVNRQQFQAYGAALTSSRIGVPRYWFQSGAISITDNQIPLADPFTNQPLLDPATGEPQVEHQLLATSRDNFVYLAGVPVLYWPYIASDLTKPTYYVDRVRVKNDRVFGTQVLLDLDLYQLLGIRNHPPQNKWTLSTDVLSERGLGLGTNYLYEGETFFSLPGPYRGFLDSWAIKDDGLDNLGRDRREVPLEEDYRGRILGHHRQQLPNNFQLTAEVGYISDRNFLEQYYELEWDTLKDQTTGVELKQFNENRSWSLSADVRTNDFFTQTENLPRFDHFMFGQSLLFDRLTWHEHTSIGYARLEAAEAPTNPIDLAKFARLPGEANREGLRAITRQELDLPLQAGPVKIVPYILGEAGYWGSDINDEEVSRLFGQAGVRASLPVWRANPNVQSELFNLNGLAHKIVYEAEVLYAEADENIERFPIYEQLDDDAQEQFRRRLLFNTFGLTAADSVPARFDPRNFAIRSNLQGSVASPSMETVEDLTEVRLGVKQRWQTKRGLPGQERVIDWIVLDVDAVLFPKPERDNFGQELGLINYDFRWHIGDRLTLLSDGFADTFSDGLRQVTLGGIISRPEQGNLYVGFRSTEGPISSNVLAASLSYRMSEKWIGTAGTSIDFSSAGNIGQNVSMTRVGESFLIRMGFNFDASRDNVGVVLGIEPRFLPSSQLGRVGGVQIPPAGSQGLE